MDINNYDEISLQDYIFCSSPTRRELVEYVSNVNKKYYIQVFRNHSFELVEHTISAYLDYSQLGISFIYSGYDDSFSFAEINEEADAYIIWIDEHRYKIPDIEDFIISRTNELRSKTTKPIIVITIGTRIPGCDKTILFWNLDDIKEIVKDKFIDERTHQLTGTRLSSKSLMEISKKLGLYWLPNILGDRIKAIVLDLDNTLYSGVLGEDGSEGIILDEGHKRLQALLRELGDRGIFICIASKNEEEDVIEMFKKRSDFPLKLDDFTKICASWDSKAKSIKNIVDYLNIGIDSVLFIDDNPGELQNVKMIHPDVHLIHAKEDANITCLVIENYPGLYNENEVINRRDDVKANEIRFKMKATSISREDYIKNLEISLSFGINNIDDAERVTELSNKTNQFIFSYKRYNLSDVIDRIKSDKWCVVTVSMKDRLSDSGLIACCIGRKHTDNYVELEECFMSCRALGRDIEDVIIGRAIKCILNTFNSELLKVVITEGERNAPARKYVNEYLKKYIDEPCKYSDTLDEQGIEILIRG